MAIKTILPTTTALALSVLLWGAALGAAPTYSGTLTCISASDGTTVVVLNTLGGASKHDIGYWKRYWTSETGFCEARSVDTSGLTQGT